jgi:hypothetical protein
VQFQKAQIYDLKDHNEVKSKIVKTILGKLRNNTNSLITKLTFQRKIHSVSNNKQVVPDLTLTKYRLLNKPFCTHYLKLLNLV